MGKKAFVTLQNTHQDILFSNAEFAVKNRIMSDAIILYNQRPGIIWKYSKVPILKIYNIFIHLNLAIKKFTSKKLSIQN